MLKIYFTIYYLNSESLILFSLINTLIIVCKFTKI